MATATCLCCGKSVEGTVQLHSHPEIKICYQCLDWLNMRRDRQVASSGGGWKVIGIEPIFTVADVERSVDHYTRLGFLITYHDETYAFVHRDDDLTVHLAQADGETSPKIGSLYMHVYDADKLADDWRKAGLEARGRRSRGLRLRQARRITHRSRWKPHTVRITSAIASFCPNSPLTVPAFGGI